MEALTQIAVVLVIAVPVLVLASPFLLTARVVRLVRRRGMTVSAALLTPGSLVAIFLVAMALAGFTYLWAIFSGTVYMDPEDICGVAVGQPDALVTGIRYHYAPPVQATCEWSDGRRRELVSWWVNPLFFAWLTIAAGALLSIPAGLVVSRLEKAAG